MAHPLCKELNKLTQELENEDNDLKVTDLDQMLDSEGVQKGRTVEILTEKLKSSSRQFYKHSTEMQPLPSADNPQIHLLQQEKAQVQDPETSTDDTEDTVTVKYLPIDSTDIQPNNRNRTLPGVDHREHIYNNQDQENNDLLNKLKTEESKPPEKDTYFNQIQESNIRIVEHVRHNLTLFERNREIYEVCEPNHKPEIVECGQLQTLLNQKQVNKTHLNQINLEPKSVIDQYTQYRATDLVNPTQPRAKQENCPKVASSRAAAIRQPLDAIKVKQTSLNTNRQRSIDSNKAREKQYRSFRKSFTSINDILVKKPVSFLIKKSRGEQLDSQQVSKAKLVVNNEEQYKEPVKQSYSTAQCLYLTPAPDSTVHIATKTIKDIILAHQRALQNSKLQVSSSPNSKLNHLFGSYSLKRNSNKQTSKSHLETTSRKRRGRLDGTGLSRFQHSKRLEKDQQGFNQLDTNQVTLDQSASGIKAKIKMPSGKSDKATIVDNKDGTIKISYEPKEVGQHEISLRYNDEPIDESPIVFYVDTVGTAKKKITAYGSGLTHGLVGENCKFTINTGGLGSAKLSVVVEGPSKTAVTLNDNKDGTISVGYLPLVPGEYKIKISFDGKQVVGSPFTTFIGDEGRQRSHVNVQRGSEHSIDLKIGEDDLKTLIAIITTPCGLEEPCGLKLLKNGQLAIVFTPREQGEHFVNVKRMGNHIGGSPFKFDVLSRDIGDAKQVRVSGKGLKEGKTNTENEIIINTKEAGFGGLSVSLEGPGRTEIMTKEQAVEGTVKLVYKPYEPGFYNLIVKYADHVVPGSPFNIKVSGQGTNSQKEYIKKFRKATPIEDVNTECHFSFKLPGVSAYDLSGRIHSPQGNVEDVSIKDKGDFIYQVTFVPKEVGLYSLSIRNKDIHTSGSPFPFTVGPLTEFGPHKVRCGGPGLIKGVCGKLNEFNVFTREAGAGELHVIVEGPSKPEIYYTDRKDGSCHVGYKVSEPGEYRCSVLFNEQEVPDSPFRAVIIPLTGEVSKIELGPMPPDNMIQLNKPCNMTVIMNGAKGNIEGKVRFPSGKTEDCFASPIDAENWGVRFIPRELGIHQVHIKFNKGASHIPQSPIFIRVGHDNADPASVVAHGHGLRDAIVNHATDFTIETCNAGHALLEVNIEGPSKVSMGCFEIDEGYKVNYTPLAAGEYIISIKYNGCHIGSSPYRIRAIKQPGSRTVADVGSHEISTITIATTDREVKQKVEHMPKFKSDASRIYCKGMGLKKAFSGKPNTLTVNCSEAGFNMIYASFLGPTRNTIHECNIKHMGGSIYEVKYMCKDRGDAILIVKYGDEQIPGSPFRLECV